MLLYLRLMDSHRDKRSKKGQDEVGPSKRGCRAVVVHRPPPPRPTHHPSHSSDEEEDPKDFKIHSPQERTKWVVLKYSKKTKQETINEAHGAPMYSDSQQCTIGGFGPTSTRIGTGPSITTRRSM
jgi:hypothetical protein